MDVCLDILVRRVELQSKVRRCDRSVYWEGDEHGQSPPVFTWADRFEMRDVALPSRVLSRLPTAFHSGEWLYLSINDSAVRELEQRVNGDAEGEGLTDLECFLTEQLVDEEAWALVFQPQCDRIDEVMKADCTGAIKSLRASLDWNGTGRGFVAFHVVS